MTFALILSSLLAFAEPPPDYATALTQLELASKQANRSIEPAIIEELEQALGAIEAFSVDLARDSAGRESYALALLNLARLYLANDRETDAHRAMDRAIFAAGIAPLEAERFGPDIAALYHARLDALEQRGRAPLDVTCHVPCKVFVDANALGGTSAQLYQGTHRVDITSASDESVTTEIELTADGAALEYGEPLRPADEAREEPTGRTWETIPTKLAWGTVERPIPRWKLAGLGVSGGMFLASSAVAIGLTVAISGNGSIRQEVLDAAQASLDDDKPSNDVDPNTGGDLCGIARTPIDPTRPDEVTNAEVTRVCIKADNYASAATGLYVVAGVSALSTVAFGLLLNTHRVPKSRGRARVGQPSFVLMPRLEGGIVAVGGFHF